MNRDYYSPNTSSPDGRGGGFQEDGQPLKVDTLDAEGEYRVDQFGKAIVGPGGIGEFGLGPRGGGGAGPRGGPGSCGPGAKILLSPEDMKVLRECNRESFRNRCLPLLMAGNLLVYMFYQNKAPATGNPRRIGAYVGVSVGAWILGKISYRSKCEDKLMNAGHNSTLVEMLRKRKGIVSSEFEPDQSWQSGTLSSQTPSDWRNEDQQQNREPSFGSYEDADQLGSNEGEGGYTSYDTLRQQNRWRQPSSSSPSRDQFAKRPTF